MYSNGQIETDIQNLVSVPVGSSTCKMAWDQWGKSQQTSLLEAPNVVDAVDIGIPRNKVDRSKEDSEVNTFETKYNAWRATRWFSPGAWSR